MTSRRWLGVAIATAAATAVAAASVSAAASASATHGNYRGPARPAQPAHAITIAHPTNYRGPARMTFARPAFRADSNLPASQSAQR
jgi:hypothetical protein